MVLNNKQGRLFLIALLIIYGNLAVIRLAFTRENNDKKYTEVVIIATQHFITDMPDGYTPAHLRALLTEVSPDVLAVEAPSNVDDPWQLAPLDLWQITKPWAQRQHLEIIPVGWYEPKYQSSLSKMFETFKKKGKYLKYQMVEKKFQFLSSRQAHTCEFINSKYEYNLWRDYHTQLHNLYGKDTAWEKWNKKIINNIIKLCEQYKGKRVAVVFGGAHCYYIHDYLAKEKEIKIISTTQFFPLSRAKLDAWTYRQDYLKALRLLNLEVGMLNNLLLRKLGGFLDKIKEFSEFDNDHHLFRGKFLLHSRQFLDALGEFKKVASIAPDIISLFDGRTYIRETALVYVAITLAKMRKYVQAAQNLERIIQMPDITAATKQWARQLLESVQ